MRDSVDALEITAIPLAAVEYVWSDVEPMLEKATNTSGGRYNTIAVLDALLKGDIALWVVLDEATPVAAMTTRVTQFPNGRRSLAIDWIGGGRMKEWLPLVQETFVRYARDNGCTEIQGFGRKGWERVLRTYGWKPEYIAYKMDLSDG